MKIGIMQPYFVPYIGYWQLMNAVDRYVIYDDVNYINRGWVNRNRILLNGQPHYLNVPMIGASQNKLIRDIAVDLDERHARKSLQMIRTAYGRAPFFHKVYPLVEKILCCQKDHLADFIAESFRILCAYLGITTELILSSSLDKDNTLKGQEKILAICEKLGATEYYNAIGGRELYSFAAFREKGIMLKFLQTDAIEYRQFGEAFQSNLSIIDVMMFNDRDTVQSFLSRYTLIRE